MVATGRREIRLVLDGSGADEMGDALIAAPFSSTLKRLFLSELFGNPHFHAGPEGVTYFPGATAPDTGDFRIKAQLGRAGVALARAFRALRACTLDEVGDSCHAAFPSEIEITPEMVEAGADAFYGPDWGHEPVERAVERIYRAMCGASHRICGKNRKVNEGTSPRKSAQLRGTLP